MQPLTTPTCSLGSIAYRPFGEVARLTQPKGLEGLKARDDRGGFRMRLVAMMTHWSDAVTLCIVNIALAVDRLARPCPDVTPHTYHLTPLVYF